MLQEISLLPALRMLSQVCVTCMSALLLTQLSLGILPGKLLTVSVYSHNVAGLSAATNASIIPGTIPPVPPAPTFDSIVTRSNQGSFNVYFSPRVPSNDGSILIVSPLFM